MTGPAGRDLPIPDTKSATVNAGLDKLLGDARFLAPAVVLLWAAPLPPPADGDAPDSVKTRSLLPIAIKLDWRETKEAKAAIFTPPAVPGSDWAWDAAKSAALCADNHVHQSASACRCKRVDCFLGSTTVRNDRCKRAFPVYVDLTPPHSPPVRSHYWWTHGACEPYIVAARRNLSTRHPLAQLLAPHMKYNLFLCESHLIAG